MAKWKSFADAATADNVARAVATAAAARDGVVYPFVPASRGAGRRPSPGADTLVYWVRPVDNLVPDLAGASTLDARMVGAVEPSALSPTDQAKLRDDGGRLPPDGRR